MAQRRRKEQQMKKQQRVITALCIAGGVGAVLLSLVICILIFRPFAASAPVSAPVATALPFSASSRFPCPISPPRRSARSAKAAA